MTIQDDLVQAECAVRKLENAVRGLRVRLGSHIDVLRLADDATRCAADLRRLENQTSAQRQVSPQEVFVITDEEYDFSLWAGGDVDSEGLGAPRLRAR